MIGTFTTSLAAGAEVEAFDDVRLSKLKLIKADSAVALGILADNVDVTAEIFAGTELVAPTQPVSSSLAAAGQLPKIPDDIQFEFFALPLDELSCVLRNNNATTARNVSLIVSVNAA